MRLRISKHSLSGMTSPLSPFRGLHTFTPFLEFDFFFFPFWLHSAVCRILVSQGIEPRPWHHWTDSEFPDFDSLESRIGSALKTTSESLCVK